MSARVATLEQRAVALIRQAAALPTKEVRLLGLDEIATLTGKSKSTVSSWFYRDKSLPEPVARLRIGPVWDAGVVEEWWAEKSA